MRHLVIGALLASGLSACAPAELSETQTRNPHHLCRAQGIEFGTDAFRACVETEIAERCEAAGHPVDTPGFPACSEQLRQATFLAQQLELRGYRMFNETF